LTAEIFYKNGSVRKLEFYYGATYLSQSSRSFPVSDDLSKVIITDFSGRKRQVE
jgi:enediyne biosynthesis protein E4